MNSILIIKIIFGILLTAGIVILSIITFIKWYKYILQESDCNKNTKGYVKGYTITRKGPENSGVHLPVVIYNVEGRDYKVIVPEYKKISFINKTSPMSKNDMEFE
ncbi:hypothetical protein [Peptostreptococcus equinus]|uniref:DUF3592 domain-containing protein n=1 Tax=Peptostreptococcus equinus TaxID=3003601 RepID=A0ABY7JPS4_9FIRM|nr:hypothetical protein [Peptostreptococcus sp. CBA3647]WAW15373.1 hypothetical protein O0R46_02705 [Peptostreptococcus sp. CBA3647]